MNKLKIKTPIAIVGLGISGEAALQLLLTSGFSREEIATFDSKSDSKTASNIEADFKSPEKLIQQFHPKTLVVSPGVPLSLPWIVQFAAEGGIITSELSLALQVVSSEKIIGVTGSLGKSTVVSILEAGLRAFSKTGFVGGNLGVPLSVYANNVLLNHGESRADWVVLELSSYQLENCAGLVCDFSAITYLTPNHLERYPSLEAYYRTKWTLTEITREAVVLNRRGGDLESFANQHETKQLVVLTDRSDPTLSSLSIEQSLLLGAHNQDNFAIACRLALLAKWPTQAIEAMKSFRGLSHRVENIGVYDGVTYVNDSKATTMESVRTAVESLRPTVRGQIHLLLGGRDKALPWEELGTLELLDPIHFYFFGECRSVAHHKSKLTADEFETLGNAFQAARAVAKHDDLILLSPGGTSLDEFKNFEERGDFFRRLVLSK